MQPERQISIALTGIGAALAVPEYVAISHHHAAPGASLAVGTLLGALGVFLGSCVAAGYSERPARVFRLLIWALAALAFSGAALLGAGHAASWGGRALFGVAGVLPLTGPVLVMTRLR